MTVLKKKKLALPAPDVFDVSGDTKKKKKKVDDEPVKKKKKRPVEDTDEDDERPKKKRDLVAYSEEEAPRSMNKTRTLLRTQFGKGAEKILKMIEQEETDPAMALLYRHLLSSVVDILPLAEMGIRKSKGTRGTYQFVQLISTTRELMVDIQAAQDRGMMGESIFESVVRPSAHDLAQTIVQEYSMMGADLKATLSAEDYEKVKPILKDSRDRLANSMTKDFRAIREGLIGYLQR